MYKQVYLEEQKKLAEYMARNQQYKLVVGEDREEDVGQATDKAKRKRSEKDKEGRDDKRKHLRKKPPSAEDNDGDEHDQPAIKRPKTKRKQRIEISFPHKIPV